MVLSAGLFCLRTCFALGDEVLLAINEADGKLRVAFEGVFEAEKAGANVSGLIGKLNEAGRILAEAESAYRVGDFSEAMALARECSVLAEDILSQASSLRERAVANAERVFWRNLTISIFGAAAFLVVLFFAWGWFKRAYVKRMLNMKPEVSVDVED